MKDIIFKINQIDAELKRRYIDCKLDRYNTGEKKHKKQIQFHECEKRNRWVFGGNRSGKTECGAVECVWWARGNHPYRKNKENTIGWVVSLSTQVQRDVAQRKVLEYIKKEWIVDVVMLSGKKDNLASGVIDYIDIKNVFGGVSRIGFKSCDQGREKFQGTSLDYVWFDEEPPFDIYEECRMRVMDRVGHVWGTMTPLKGLTWVYYAIYLNEGNDNEIWTTQMEWADNPYLDVNEVDSMTKTMSQDVLNSRRYGKFSSSTGLVYTEFDESVHVIDPFDVPKEWYDKMSIDPGLNNPLSVHWYAVDYDGNVYVIAEHYEAGKDIYYHADCIKKTCERLNWHKESNGNYLALIDSAANQKTLACSKSVAELFYENGINANTRVNKDMFSGISKVKNYLKIVDGKPSLYIFKTCSNLVREIKSYWWGEADIPKKKDDHALDELRYYIMSRPEKAVMEKKQKSLLAIEKERLAKKITRQNKYGF